MDLQMGVVAKDQIQLVNFKKYEEDTKRLIMTSARKTAVSESVGGDGYSRIIYIDPCSSFKDPRLGAFIQGYYCLPFLRLCLASYCTRQTVRHTALQSVLKEGL